MGPAKRTADASHADEQVLCCPLCITELDATEQAWAPCACGYQLCLFCYDRIKSEFSNQCPGCRTPYDSEFQVNLVQRKEAAGHAQHAGSPTHAAAGAGAEPSARHPAPAAAAAAGPYVPASPGRDLHIDEEQFWPSLSSAAQSGKGSAAATATASTSRHTSPRGTPSPPAVATRAGGGWAGRGYAAQRGEQQEGGEPLPPDQLQNEGSTSSSATTATTPQSPASSVVAYRARATSSVVELLQGTCHVSLPPSALAPPPLDEEGANLALSLQEAVKAGSVSVKQAAASLVSYLRQKQLGAAAGVGGGGGGGLAATPGAPPPLHGSYHRQQQQQQPFAGLGGLAADAGRASPFGGGLFGGAAPPAGLVLEDSPSLAASEALTFAQWGRSGSLLSPMSSIAGPGAGLFEGWSGSPQHSPRQQLLQPAAAPVRSGGRLPLYARGAASALTSSSQQQPEAGAGFPGFQPASPVQQRVPALVASPPGFSRSMHSQQQAGLLI